MYKIWTALVSSIRKTATTKIRKPMGYFHRTFSIGWSTRPSNMSIYVHILIIQLIALPSKDATGPTTLNYSASASIRTCWSQRPSPSLKRGAWRCMSMMLRMKKKASNIPKTSIRRVSTSHLKIMRRSPRKPSNPVVILWRDQLFALRILTAHQLQDNTTKTSPNIC